MNKLSFSIALALFGTSAFNTSATTIVNPEFTFLNKGGSNIEVHLPDFCSKAACFENPTLNGGSTHNPFVKDEFGPDMVTDVVIKDPRIPLVYPATADNPIFNGMVISGVPLSPMLKEFPPKIPDTPHNPLYPWTHVANGSGSECESNCSWTEVAGTAVEETGETARTWIENRGAAIKDYFWRFTYTQGDTITTNPDGSTVTQKGGTFNFQGGIGGINVGQPFDKEDKEDENKTAFGSGTNGDEGFGTSNSFTVFTGTITFTTEWDQYNGISSDEMLLDSPWGELLKPFIDNNNVNAFTTDETGFAFNIFEYGVNTDSLVFADGNHWALNGLLSGYTNPLDLTLLQLGELDPQLKLADAMSDPVIGGKLSFLPLTYIYSEKVIEDRLLSLIEDKDKINFIHSLSHTNFAYLSNADNFSDVTLLELLQDPSVREDFKNYKLKHLASASLYNHMKKFKESGGNTTSGSNFGAVDVATPDDSQIDASASAKDSGNSSGINESSGSVTGPNMKINCETFSACTIDFDAIRGSLNHLK